MMKNNRNTHGLYKIG